MRKQHATVHGGARPGRFQSQGQQGPRPAALVKAALRQDQKIGHVSSAAVPPAAPSDTSRDVALRPKVDFLDPLMRHAALQAKGIGLCAFLVTLAAFQRGLKVTFHYERATFDPRFARTRVQGHRGEVFSISHGARTHAFSRTMGDRTEIERSAIAEDKHLTKVALRQAGVLVPDGVVVPPGQGALIQRFLDRHHGRRFVVKPFDGSLARGVEADLGADEVLAAAQRQANNRILVEEFIAGVECRATVVGGRCVAVSQRSPVMLVGDGQSSIAALLATENSAFAADPFMDALSDQAAIKAYLARHGLTLQSVPEAGQAVRLTNTSYGVLHADVTDTVGDAVKAEAVRAVQAIGLPNAGVDLIITPDGRVVVLEVNQRAHIGMHSFPRVGHGQGNAVAEAIIDLYFPETIGAPTHPALVYDFAAVRRALESAQIAELSLPVIGSGAQVLRLFETGHIAAPTMQLLEAAALASGILATKAPLPERGFAMCLAGAPQTFANFLVHLPPRLRERVQDRIQAT